MITNKLLSLLLEQLEKYFLYIIISCLSSLSRYYFQVLYVVSLYESVPLEIRKCQNLSCLYFFGNIIFAST